MPLKKEKQKYLEQEFDVQVNNLIQKQYPKLAGLSTQKFLQLIEPLRAKVKKLAVGNAGSEKGFLPFVIVVSSGLVGAKKAMAKVKREGKKGVDIMRPHQPKDFKPAKGTRLPDSPAYLLVDIERGQATRNVRPSDALKFLKKNKRLPLTMEEGVAIVTHYPEFLQKNNCFSLLASRIEGNKRVPAIWINGKKQPNLGWCWDGNPHTWLGSASAAKRVG